MQEAVEAQEAKESELEAVKAHQSVQVMVCEMPGALQAAAEAVEVAEAQQARVEDQQDPPPQDEAAGHPQRAKQCASPAKQER